MLIKREFGSEYWIDKNIPNMDSLTKHTSIFEENEILLASGRACLSLLLDQIENLPKTVLLPSYTCDSVAGPFLTRGVKRIYYGTDRLMQPNLLDIERAVKNGPVIFIHMGHFGFDTNAPLKDLMPVLSESGSIIIEDITHTLFNTEHPLPSHCRIASIRKWLGLPSGGVIFPGVFESSLREPDFDFSDFFELRLKAMNYKREHIEDKNDDSLKDKYLSLFSRAEDKLTADDRAYRMDKTSQNILAGADFEDLKKRRRENYLALLKGFSNIEKITPVFTALPDHVCPLFFPTFVDMSNRNYQKLFAQRGLYTAIHWPKNEDDTHSCSDLDYIQTHILSIPCDQRYSLQDMNTLLEIIHDCLSSI